jgi:7-cyano-7-deazaguanine synthase
MSFTRDSLNDRSSIVLLSGGLDSAANLALAVSQGETIHLALTAHYGQRAFERELEAARKLAQYYGVRHELVDLTWLGALGGSALTANTLEVPTLQATELDELARIRETARAVWVPNRNGVLLNVAAAYAERLGAESVLVGFNREEATTFPDNSESFLQQATEALTYSTRNGVRVRSFTTQWDKTEMVRALRALPKRFPFELVWSCYHGGRELCGKCESCQRFSRALAASENKKAKE